MVEEEGDGLKSWKVFCGLLGRRGGSDKMEAFWMSKESTTCCGRDLVCILGLCFLDICV